MEIRIDPFRSRLRAFRRRLSEECGQTLVMFALGMVSILAFTSIVFDVSVIYERRRELQNAADGAALAAARELPGSPPAAVAAAHDYLAKNGFPPSEVDVAAKVVTPYDGDDQHVEVTVTRLNEPFLFARLVGNTSLDIKARAVAEVVTSYTDEYAIFAIESNCGAPGIEIGGSLANIVGTVHGNSNVSISGTGHTIDPAITYHCTFKEDGSGHTYTREQKSTGVRDIPSELVGVNYDSFAPCTFYFANNVNLKAQNVTWLDAAKTQLVPGVYCFGRDVTLIGDDIAGQVTFVAKGHISISGSDHLLEAYHPSGILLYSESSTGTYQIEITGSGGTWSGIVYAPNGDISFSGQGSLNYEGSLVARNVEVSGSNVSITSSKLGSNGSPVVRLIE